MGFHASVNPIFDGGKFSRFYGQNPRFYIFFLVHFKVVHVEKSTLAESLKSLIFDIL